jgi:hypothetical protein
VQRSSDWWGAPWNTTRSHRFLFLHHHHLIEVEEVFMHSKLAFPVLVVASLFAATTFASARAPATSDAAMSNAAKSNAMASMHHHHYRHHAMGYSRRAMDKSRPGGLPVSRKAAD